MALNLRKLGKYMERKQRKKEKPSPILKVIIKIGLGFFWRKDYCPTLFSLITPLPHFASQRHQSDKWLHPTNLPNVRHKSQWRYHQPRLG